MNIHENQFSSNKQIKNKKIAIHKRPSTAPQKYKIKEKTGNLLLVQIVIVVLVNVVQYAIIYHVNAAVSVAVVLAPA